jgi:hypothetical protein
MTPRDAARRRLYESPALIGCALAIGRGLYQELWGFDAAMRSWGVEDIDFGLKAWLLGYPILHDPQALVGHRFRQAFDNYDVPPADLLANQLRFARKHFTSAVWSQWVESCRQRNQGPLPGHPEGLWARAWSVFEEGRESVEQERQRLHSRRTRDEFEYAAKYGLDWPRLAVDRGESSPSASASVAEHPAEGAQLLQIQPSGSPPPPPQCGLTGITPKKVAICPGHEVEFTAEGKDVDDVEWAAPGATPATYKGKTFKTKWTTPVGETTVYARCGPGTEQFSARVIVLKVEFDQNSIRTGYRYPSQSINIDTGMVVTPPELAAAVIPKRGGDVPSRIKEPTVQSVNPETGRVVFQVGGEKATDAKRPDGDTEIVIKYKDQTDTLDVLGIDSAPRVIVIVPEAIKTPHPDASGFVTGMNMALDSESTPVFFKIEPGYAALATVYLHQMQIEVVDQFGELLDPIYDGSLVREKIDNEWYSIEQKLMNGTYTDPVGGGTFIMDSIDPKKPELFKAGLQVVKDWPTQPRLSAKAGEYIQNFTVDVALHNLLDRIGGDPMDDTVKARKVTVTPDPDDPTRAKVDIDWP